MQSWRLCREDQTALCSASDAANIAHTWSLCSEDQSARHAPAAIKIFSKVPRGSAAPAPAPAPPIGSGVTRSQGKASAKAVTGSAATGHPYTYNKAIDSPQWDHWNRAMEEECTSILFNNTFSALNSREARQLRVQPIGSKWVYKKNLHPDGSTRYYAQLVIKR